MSNKPTPARNAEGYTKDEWFSYQRDLARMSPGKRKEKPFVPVAFSARTLIEVSMELGDTRVRLAREQFQLSEKQRVVQELSDHAKHLADLYDQLSESAEKVKQ